MTKGLITGIAAFVLLIAAAGCGSSGHKADSTTTTTVAASSTTQAKPSTTQPPASTTTTKPASTTTTKPATPTTGAAPATTAPKKPLTKAERIIDNTLVAMTKAGKALKGNFPQVVDKACASTLIGLRYAQVGARPTDKKLALEWAAVIKKMSTTMTTCVADSTSPHPTAYEAASVRTALRDAIFDGAIQIRKVSKAAGL